ncbi:hypothetical protein ACWC5I_37500 [Kitasatospora sp. NPDC001574]
MSATAVATAATPTAVTPPRVQSAHPRPGAGGLRADRDQKWFRHRPGSAPERVRSAPERGREHSVEQPPEQPSATAAPGADPAGAGGQTDSADTTGSAVVALGRPDAQAVAAPVVLPARWHDASTLQLPLGAGLGLIGCGLGLIGLRLRRS